MTDKQQEIQSLTEQIENASDDSELYSKRGYAQWVAGQLEQALVDFNRAIELNPANFTALTHRAHLSLYFENYDEVVSDCTRAIEAKPDSVMPYAVRGYYYTMLDDEELAKKDFDRATENSKGLGYRYHCYLKAYYLYWFSHYLEALQECEQYLDIAEDDFGALSLSAKIHFELGDYEQAINFHKKALKVNPENPDEYLSYGITLMETKSSHEAIDTFSRYISMTNNADGYVHRGLVYGIIHKVNKAKKDLIKALSIEPNNGLAHHAMGVILYEGSNIKKAYKHFKKASLKINDFYDLYLYYGKVALAMGFNDEALERINQAIDLCKDNEDLSYLYWVKAFAYDKLNDSKSALKWLRKSSKSGYAEFQDKTSIQSFPSLANNEEFLKMIQ